MKSDRIRFMGGWATGLCLLAASIITANAWHVSGRVSCPNGVVFSNVLITIQGTTSQGALTGSDTTDANGEYFLYLPDFSGSFTATIDPSTLPAGASVVGPLTVDFVTTDESFVVDVSWEIAGEVCEE